MTAKEIIEQLKFLGGYHSIVIPEFTYGGLRIDALVIDLRDRWCRGFEVKVDRGDFLKDNKWTLYTQFCSSLTIACPRDLIKKEEVENPFGLLWVDKGNKPPWKRFEWIKRPRNFQKRNSLSWVWTYLKVLEQEFPRMFFELDKLKVESEWLKKNNNKLIGGEK